jgi:membrane-bound lytic murein transglycosylase A
MSYRSYAPIGALAFLASCATAPTPTPTPSKPTPGRPTVVEGPAFTLAASTFGALPGWTTTDPAPALEAFRRSCATLSARPDDQRFGRLSAYGGAVVEWRAACAAAPSATDARAFFEANFTPYEVMARADQLRKVTGYYEPVIEARRTPQPGFEEPFLARPADLVGVDFSQFDDQLELSKRMYDDVMKQLAADLPDEAEPKAAAAIQQRLQARLRTSMWGRLTPDRKIVPYPARAAISRTTGVLAYGRACEVYDVQVQGSARVAFEDGQQMRMAYAAQNGWKWNSIYPQLRDRGDIPAANKTSVCAWMSAQSQDVARNALALDPSYVFFALEPIGDPRLGPKGAQGVPLTALGSAAVDPAAHPYGAPLFIAGDGFNRLLVAQDTGGAIKRGAVRADVFYGTGPEAGAAATQMNMSARFFTLLPNGASALVASATPGAATSRSPQS